MIGRITEYEIVFEKNDNRVTMARFTAPPLDMTNGNYVGVATVTVSAKDIALARKSLANRLREFAEAIEKDDQAT